MPLSPPPGWNREQYDFITENRFLGVAGNPLSTFSIDVDRASYSNVRRFLREGVLPPVDAVRIEEMVNYFPYDYARPSGEDPFAVTTEVGPAPWRAGHLLLRIGLASAPVETTGLVLPSTPGSDKERILDAIERLTAGGSTAGGAGLALAYAVAREYHIADGNNRIILGFGTGNLQSEKMQKLAQHGNGNYAYIDSREWAFVRVRYKAPGEDVSRLLEHPVNPQVGAPSPELRFAAAVAGFGMLLRESEYRGTVTAEQVLSMARGSLGEDPDGYRAEFIRMVERYRSLVEEDART